MIKRNYAPYAELVSYRIVCHDKKQMMGEQLECRIRHEQDDYLSYMPFIKLGSMSNRRITFRTFDERRETGNKIIMEATKLAEAFTRLADLPVLVRDVNQF